MRISRNQGQIIAGVLQKKSLSRACYQRLMNAFVCIKAGALFLLGIPCGGTRHMVETNVYSTIYLTTYGRPAKGGRANSNKVGIIVEPTICPPMTEFSLLQ